MSLTLHIQLISGWEPLQSKGETPLPGLLSRWLWPGINRLLSSLGKCAVVRQHSPLALPRGCLPSPAGELVQLCQPCEWDVSTVQVGVFPTVGLACVRCWAVCSVCRFLAVAALRWAREAVQAVGSAVEITCLLLSIMKSLFLQGVVMPWQWDLSEIKYVRQYSGIL